MALDASFRIHDGIDTVGLQMKSNGYDFTVWMEFVTSLIGEAWFYVTFRNSGSDQPADAQRMRHLRALRAKEQLWLIRTSAPDSEIARLSVVDKRGNTVGELDDFTSRQVLGACKAGRLWLACFYQLKNETDGSVTAQIGMVQVAVLTKVGVNLQKTTRCDRTHMREAVVQDATN